MKNSKFNFENKNKQNEKISASIEENIIYIKAVLNETNDLIVKEIEIKNTIGSLIYLESISDIEKIQTNFLKVIQESEEKYLDTILKSMEVEIFDDLDKGIENILLGKCLLILNNYTQIFLLPTVKVFNRTITEPTNEKVIRGSHEGFVEDIMINLSLIRKYINNPNLTIKYLVVGNESKTKVAIVYLRNLANSTILKEVERRINSISSDMVTSPGYMEEFIEDTPSSIFPQLLNTEKPSRVMANLLEGRIAVFAHGSPTALILPITFFAFYQSPDDYNSRWMIGTFYRIIRLISFIIAIILPAFYIAVTAFHFEVIPPDLVLIVKGSIDRIPYPPLIEAFILEIIIELIREAGIRLPTSIGQTIAIVGGLVIGDAIVKAGLVSNIMIIVVALTSIASFVVPSNEMNASITLLRFPFMILASFLGFIGITFGMVVLGVHLCKLESFGIPYFAPLAPLKISDLKDTFVRLPVWKFNTRPLDSHAKKIKQQGISRKWKNEKK